MTVPNDIDIMDTLELANDYANDEWDVFTEKWQSKLNPGVYEYLDKNKAHREEWKGVPISRTGKIQLRDGRTGEEFDNPVTVGCMHYLKLRHLLMIKSMPVQPVRTPLLHSSRWAVRHSLADSVSERWRFGPWKPMVHPTPFRKSLHSSPMMLPAV